MADAADNEGEKRRAALENWRRVTVLWTWLGRDERDKELSTALKRAAGLESHEILDRARNGDPRAGGQFRIGTARAIVGPLLGVGYPNDKANGLRNLDNYPSGAGSPAFVAYLRGLPSAVHLDLADRWVEFLRSNRHESPAAWDAAVPTTDSPSNSGTAPALRGGASKSQGVAQDTAQEKPRAAPVEQRSPNQFESAETVVAKSEAPAPTTRDAAGTAPSAGSSRVVGLALAGAGLIALLATVGFLMMSRASEVPTATKESEPPPAPSQPPSPTPAPTPPQHDDLDSDDADMPVRISIQSQRAGSPPNELLNGGTLRSGDQFAFRARSSEPLFVYLIALDEHGKASLLYPEGRDLQLLPNQTYRLPQEPDRSLELDDEIGAEHMMLLFTKGPLSPTHAELPALLRAVKNESAWPTNWPQLDSAVAQAEPHKTRGATVATVHTRGVRIARSAGAQTPSNAADVVTAHFITIEHRK